MLQGYSVVILFLLARLQPSRYTRGNDIYWVFAGYVVAKLLETFDKAHSTDWATWPAATRSSTSLQPSPALLVCRMLWLRTLQPRSGSRRFSGAGPRWCDAS
jgi:hypothetical protein